MKFLLINSFEFDQLWKILLEDVAPMAEVEVVLTLLAIVVVAAVGLSVDAIGATKLHCKYNE